MKKIYGLLLFLFLSGNDALASDEVIHAVNSTVERLAAFIGSILMYPFPLPFTSQTVPFIVLWLFSAAFFSTFYFRFINFRAFRHAIRIVRGVYDNPKDKGEVSHFQALATAISGTVGIGNIGGVAIAISVGGPGATFWIIVAGLLGMSSKFLECTLGVKYRNIHSDGSISGGPMYYLQKGFAKRGWGRLGTLLAMLFAAACIGGAFGGANMYQINQATRQLVSVTGGEASVLFGKEWIVGVLMALMVGAVIIGGIKGIARVTEKIVPMMVAVYFLGALGVLFSHLESIPAALWLIFSEAFSPSATTGGLIGVLIIGFQRAHFSNEAGLGSATFAHSAVKTLEPVSEGIVALLEPFIDTVVVCTITALVIVISGEYTTGLQEGILLTSRAFGSVFGWFPVVLAVCVVLFAFSTIISWSYYGLKSWTFLFGKSQFSETFFKLIFCLMVIFGSVISLSNVILLSDILTLSLALPNIAGLFVLAPEVKKDLEFYLSRIKTGEIKRYDKPDKKTLAAHRK
ncbi:MAG: alanine:cation symporter family protein [Cytophagales bacterium]|nr:alanine:cation symporter family protein [Cytophagales bacterium]